MDATPLISQRLAVRCLSPLERTTDAELQYDVAAPYSVTIKFDDTVGAPVWELARTLLVQGVSGAAGLGDARVWPVVDETGRSLVMLHLRSADEDVVVELLTTQLHRFLGRTLGLVPIGTETEWVDLDGLVEQLLDADAP